MVSEPWEETPWDEDDTDVVEDAVVVTEDGALVPQASAAVEFATPLTLDEARELTDHIRSTADVLYVLIYRAHAGRAWEALGYNTWAAYVQEEFNISRSRAYQILDQAKVIAAIEAATPEGTDLSISEAAARDLKSVIGEVVPVIEQRTAGLDSDEAGQVVEEIVEDFRQQQREARDARAAEDADDAADRAARAAALAEAGFAPGDYRPPAPAYDEEDGIDAALIRRNVQAAYDLYSSLSALKSMPDHESVIGTIPVERRVQINDSLRTALDWLSGFAEKWYAEPWQNSDSDAEESDFDEDFADDDFGDDEV